MRDAPGPTFEFCLHSFVYSGDNKTIIYVLCTYFVPGTKMLETENA